MAARMALTPPPIIIWYLGFVTLQKRGLIEIEFIGNSCLKYLIIYRVSGSIILDPLSAAVPKMVKSLLKASPLIFVFSWIIALLTSFPFSSYLIIYPSSVHTNKDLLSIYQRALLQFWIGFESPDYIKVWNYSSGFIYSSFIYLF